MNKTLRVPFCLLLLLFGASTLLPEGASKAATRRLSKSQKLKGGFGKPEVITGTIAKALPGQSLVVLSVPDSEPRTDTFVGVHKIVREHGQIISRSDDVTKVVKTTGSVEFAFTVSDSTLVRVNGHRATLRVLNMLANKLARVRFIPYRTGNVALEIAVTV